MEEWEGGEGERRIVIDAYFQVQSISGTHERAPTNIQTLMMVSKYTFSLPHSFHLLFFFLSFFFFFWLHEYITTICNSMLKNQVKPAVCIFDVSMIYSCADLVSKVTLFLPSLPFPSPPLPSPPLCISLSLCLLCSFFCIIFIWYN